MTLSCSTLLFLPLPLVPLQSSIHPFPFPQTLPLPHGTTTTPSTIPFVVFPISSPQAILYERPPSPSPRPPLPNSSQSPRYHIRQALQEELFSVADVRCHAFYINPYQPPDPYFYPARRRDIYLALVDRVARGNRCIVAIDQHPDESWRPFTNSEGGLVVGAVDASLYERGGRRWSFLRGGMVADGYGDESLAESGREGKEGVWTVYISSMAVREQWRGRGLARRLLKEVVDDGRRRGLKEVLLHVDEDNEAALNLYLSSGFQRWKERKKGWTVPSWLGGLARKEHTLMIKQLEEDIPDIDVGL